MIGTYTNVRRVWRPIEIYNQFVHSDLIDEFDLIATNEYFGDIFVPPLISDCV